MDSEEVEDIELDLLLEAVYRTYGYDFRRYARGSLRRRVRRRVQDEHGVETVSGLLERILRDPDCMNRLLMELSVNVTSMFRDPGFYRCLREKVVPVLRTYPYLRIWNAGCSTGEETYSLAILLEEEGLYERSRIYATDFSDDVVERARAGVFPLEKMRQYTDNYIRSGGNKAFSEYYMTDASVATFQRELGENVVFAQHNLVSDRSFNEFNLIMCRNVMIYFDKDLQNQVHDLFHKSLVHLGILALGHRESIQFTDVEDAYEELDGEERIYRKVK